MKLDRITLVQIILISASLVFIVIVAVNVRAILNPAVVSANPTTFPHTPGIISLGCNTCHQKDDIHNGVFGPNCNACHTTTAWTGATVIDHSKTALPLAGAHTSVPCAACHVNGNYTSVPTDCYSCHKVNDVHNGSNSTDCAACHSTTNWTSATVDHSKKAFPLTGTHTSVPCASCHINGNYTSVPTDCYSCHKKDDTTHNGSQGTSCGACHNTTSWNVATTSTFNHSATGFALTGAHTSIACASCHINGIYTGTSINCVSCHTDPHRGRNGTNCARCHSTSSWDRG